MSDKLIRMANQIAAFFDTQSGDDRPARLAAHLNDFWTPDMRADFLAAIDAPDLHPLARDAAPLIRRPKA